MIVGIQLVRAVVPICLMGGIVGIVLIGVMIALCLGMGLVGNAFGSAHDGYLLDW
jgi:hypothetical protein